MSSQELIKHFNLQPHPEGGFYNETYRSDILVETPHGMRSASTAIHFLITKDSISHFHRLSSDEGWHFHLGSPLKIIEITKEGDLIETILGSNFNSSEKLQYIVKAGNWFASTSLGEYSFVGCTVAPGFDFSDFEMAKFDDLSEKYPEHLNICKTYCLD